MAADLGLVVHAAKRQSHKFAVGGAGDAHGDARFTGARRANQAEQPAFELRAELTDGEVFQDAFLDLVQAKMILVQDLSGLVNIQRFLGFDAPGQLEDRVQITAQHSRFRRAEGLLL